MRGAANSSTVTFFAGPKKVTKKKTFPPAHYGRRAGSFDQHLCIVVPCIRSIIIRAICGALNLRQSAGNMRCEAKVPADRRRLFNLKFFIPIIQCADLRKLNRRYLRCIESAPVCGKHPVRSNSSHRSSQIFQPLIFDSIV